MTPYLETFNSGVHVRILHLVPNFTGGGAERQLALLAPELCRLGVEVHIAFCRSGENSSANLERLSNSDVQFHHIPNVTNYDPMIPVHIYRVIRSIKPDLVQTWILQMDVLGGLAARMAGVPFVLSERSSALMYTPSWKNWLRIQMGRLAKLVVANSQGGAVYWKPYASQTAIIRNGLSLDIIRNTPPINTVEFGIPVDARIILFAGRLSPEKNLGILVEALRKVLGERPDCIAVICGDGRLWSNLRSQAARMDVEGRIRFIGYTDKVWSWMRHASVFVSIGKFEGNPNSVLEAMAIGCPLVISDIPQHREILDETSAFWCDPHSTDDVSLAIGKALDDPVSAKARAEVAQRRTAGWSIGETARCYLQLYNTVLSEKAA